MIVFNLRTLTAAGLVAVGAANLGWSWTTPDVATAAAYAICARNFAPGNPDAPGVGAAQAKRLIAACEYGASYAHEAVYQPYRQSGLDSDFPISPPTDLRDFRRDYNVGRAQCVSGYDDKRHFQERMACLDGYDAFTAGILQRAAYDVSRAPALTFDDQYFRRQNYLTAFQDMTDDQAWAKTIEDRVFHPERFPSYRLDQIFQPVVTSPSTYGAATIAPAARTHSLYPWYLYNHYYHCLYGCGSPYAGRPTYRAQPSPAPSVVAPNVSAPSAANPQPTAPNSAWHPANLWRRIRPSVDAASRPAVRGTVQRSSPRGGPSRLTPTRTTRSFGSVASQRSSAGRGRSGGGGRRGR